MKFLNRITLLVKKIKQKSLPQYRKITNFIKRRPMTSFLVALGLLFFVLILGQILQPKQVEKIETAPTRSVSVYSIGDSPKATYQAKIQKSGVIQIIAQAPGVVSNVSVKEGDEVWKGQQIISLATNYQGGNAGVVQRQIAQKQYQNVVDTFDKQKALIQNQKDVAIVSTENADKMREISRQSLDETNSLINANQSQLDQMHQSLDSLVAANPNDPNILTLQSSINQLQGGVTQLRQAQRATEFSASNDNAPAKLANLQKDIALKQLDIQEKGLDLTKEVSKLQVNLAYINEALMYPASPFAGRVEKINVEVGQLVSPGTILATVSSYEVNATAILLVPSQVAKIIVSGTPSDLVIGNKKIAVTPYFVSTQATDGQLYSVFYDVPEDYQSHVTDGQFIAINVPINSEKVVAADPLVPIDAIYQTQDNAFVLLARNGKAETQIVTLGQVFGNFVEVLSGIHTNDHVILDRNVIAGDSIDITNK